MKMNITTISRRLPSLVLVSTLFALTACGQSDQKNASETQTSPTATTDKVVNVYNWSDYVEESTLKDFEKNTGIKVNYTVFDSNETLHAKVLAGNSGYDVVTPSHNFAVRQIDAGVYMPLDKSKIPNYKNIDPTILKQLQKVDPDNKYTVPYFWGINTIGINRPLVEKALGGPLPTNEWDLLFKPEYAKKLQSCGISVLNSPSAVLPTALHYLGKDPSGKSKEDIQAAIDLLKTVRPYIKRFSSSGYINDMARGELCLAFGYSGDFNIAQARATENKSNMKIEALIPKSGVAIWVDTFAIPKDAKNIDNAYAYINDTLDPKVAAKNGDFVMYAPGSAPAKELMKPELVNNPSIFLATDKLENSFLNVPIDLKTNKFATESWNKMKSASGSN